MSAFEFGLLALLALLGAAVQAATGFGLSAVVAPYFLLIMNSSAAIQVLAVANLTLSLTLVSRVWRSAPRDLLIHLLIGTAVSLPVGLWLFLNADLVTLKRAVGVVIILFAAILMAGETGIFARRRHQVMRGHTLVEAGVGFVAGILGVSLTLFAPPIILYMLLVRMGKEETRALMLTYFMIVYGLATLSHGIAGGMTGATWIVAVLLLPFILAGSWLGHRVGIQLSDFRFRMIILVTLVCSGVYAIATTIA